MLMKMVCTLAMALLGCGSAFAETGADAWLRYASLKPQLAQTYLPATTVLFGDSVILTTAQKELVRGVRGMLGRTLRVASGAPTESAIVIGTVEQLRKVDPAFKSSGDLQGDAYWLTSGQIVGQKALVITGASDRAVLYRTFAFLSKMACGPETFRTDPVGQPVGQSRRQH